ncbi:DUF1501 domain-containing protein [Neolewinella antarctica]|uniref:Uncharacterized protein (DUF1501 family) n=1 Tax=Neolewinella antarctica TaxID=442734 RepID=A0ABX0XBL4_9BACT|nr:DUF1501 domain-containing protein [Neolewinella antarctica]NJC26650.1 uncharacterized protein (DUF1501 family) [Neolewinella antarctica]
MKRRNFIRNTGALGLASVFSIPNLKAESNAKLTSLLDQTSDKILVLIQLNGGNDGLNTVIPLDQYDSLKSVRGNILMPEKSMLPITDTLAMHPNMGGMRDMFTAGSLSILQNVGYANHSKSHFRSTDIWNTGSNVTNVLPTGWLGRYFHGDLPGFPANYPNDSNPHPTSISIGKLTHPSCEGPSINFGQTVETKPTSIPLTGDDGAKLPRDNYGREMEYLRVIAEQTNDYASSIDTAYAAGKNSSSYPSSVLADQLSTVARLINGGLKTSVYTVRLNGFDTHADQVQGNGTVGKQALLLKQVSEAITAFNADLKSQGNEDRVLGLTYSEFGRRIRSNASKGTDHGAANSMFLFGPCLQQSVLGNNPVIDTQVLQSDSLKMEYDFRDIYGSILRDWFDVRDARIRDILYPNYTYLPLAGVCSRALPVDMFDFVVGTEGKNAEISWRTTEEVDNKGFEIERSTDGINYSYMSWVSSTSRSETAINSYESTDGPLSVGVTYYYRVKAIAYDGEATYSPVRSVFITGKDSKAWGFSSAYPNPASRFVTLDCYAPVDGSVIFRLYNSTGRMVISDSATVYGGRENAIRIGLQRLPVGMYNLSLSTEGDGDFSRRVIIAAQ